MLRRFNPRRRADVPREEIPLNGNRETPERWSEVYRIRDGQPNPSLDPINGEPMIVDTITRSAIVLPVRESRPSDYYGFDHQGRNWFYTYLRVQNRPLRQPPRHPHSFPDGAPFRFRDFNPLFCGGCQGTLLIGHQDFGHQCCRECGRVTMRLQVGLDEGRALGIFGYCICPCICAAEERSATRGGQVDETYDDSLDTEFADRHDRIEADDDGRVIRRVVALDPVGNTQIAEADMQTAEDEMQTSEDEVDTAEVDTEDENSPTDPIPMEEITSLGLPLTSWEWDDLRRMGYGEDRLRAQFPELDRFRPRDRTPLPRCLVCHLMIPHPLLDQYVSIRQSGAEYDWCVRCRLPLREGITAGEFHTHTYINELLSADGRPTQTLCWCRCHCFDAEYPSSSSSSTTPRTPGPTGPFFGLHFRPLTYHSYLGWNKWRAIVQQTLIIFYNNILRTNTLSAAREQLTAVGDGIPHARMVRTRDRDLLTCLRTSVSDHRNPELTRFVRWYHETRAHAITYEQALPRLVQDTLRQNEWDIQAAIREMGAQSRRDHAARLAAEAPRQRELETCYRVLEAGRAAIQLAQWRGVSPAVLRRICDDQDHNSRVVQARRRELEEIRAAPMRRYLATRDRIIAMGHVFADELEEPEPEPEPWGERIASDSDSESGEVSE